MDSGVCRTQFYRMWIIQGWMKCSLHLSKRRPTNTTRQKYSVTCKSPAIKVHIMSKHNQENKVLHVKVGPLNAEKWPLWLLNQHACLYSYIRTATRPHDYFLLWINLLISQLVKIGQFTPKSKTGPKYFSSFLKHYLSLQIVFAVCCGQKETIA